MVLKGEWGNESRRFKVKIGCRHRIPDQELLSLEAAWGLGWLVLGQWNTKRKLVKRLQLLTRYYATLVLDPCYEGSLRCIVLFRPARQPITTALFLISRHSLGMKAKYPEHGYTDLCHLPLGTAHRSRSIACPHSYQSWSKQVHGNSSGSRACL